MKRAEQASAKYVPRPARPEKDKAGLFFTLTPIGGM